MEKWIFSQVKIISRILVTRRKLSGEHPLWVICTFGILFYRWRSPQKFWFFTSWSVCKTFSQKGRKLHLISWKLMLLYISYTFYYDNKLASTRTFYLCSVYVLLIIPTLPLSKYLQTNASKDKRADLETQYPSGHGSIKWAWCVRLILLGTCEALLSIFVILW